MRRTLFVLFLIVLLSTHSLRVSCYLVDHSNVAPDGKVRITCPSCGVSGSI